MLRLQYLHIIKIVSLVYNISNISVDIHRDKNVLHSKKLTKNSFQSWTIYHHHIINQFKVYLTITTSSVTTVWYHFKNICNKITFNRFGIRNSKETAITFTPMFLGVPIYTKTTYINIYIHLTDKTLNEWDRQILPKIVPWYLSIKKLKTFYAIMNIN